MERLNLIPLRKRCYRELSGGQQQRVLLARALCAAQKLLVLDEPTTGLDAESSAELYRILQELNQTESITILMVTHDLENACAAAKQVLYFEPGGYFLERQLHFRHVPWRRKEQTNMGILADMLSFSFICRALVVGILLPFVLPCLALAWY